MHSSYLILSSILNLFRANLKKGVSRKQSAPNFPNNKHFLRTCAYQGGKKFSFFGKFDVLCFFETTVLRFSLLRHVNITGVIILSTMCLLAITLEQDGSAAVVLIVISNFDISSCKTSLLNFTLFFDKFAPNLQSPHWLNNRCSIKSIFSSFAVADSLSIARYLSCNKFSFTKLLS